MDVKNLYRIRQVVIEGFRGSRTLKMNFPDDKVTIIHGSNGSGKTTLLKLLHGIFAGNSTLLESEQITKASVILKNNETEEFNFIEVEYSEEKNEFEWFGDFKDTEYFTDHFSSLVFGVNRGITTNNALGRVSPIDVSKMFKFFELEFSGSSENRRTSRTIEDISDFLNHHIQIKHKRQRRSTIEIDFDTKHLMIDNLSMSHIEASLLDRYLMEKRYITLRVQKALFETLAQVVDNNKTTNNFEIPDDFIEKLKIHADTLLEVLSELPDNQLSSKIKGILQSFKPNMLNEDFENPFADKEILSNLVNNMIIELEKGKGVLNSVSHLVEEFNTYLSSYKKLMVDERGPSIITPTGNHSIDKLSSGERHLLSFLTLFIIEGRDRNILMIDEPEISLNLKWQSKLLGLLTKCVPNAQIIVATHSPAIAEYNTNNLVEISEIEDDNNKVAAEISE